jgi:hypothetical protein
LSQNASANSILVIIDGGNVTGVFCTRPAAELEIVDYDNMRCEPEGVAEFTNPDNLAAVY